MNLEELKRLHEFRDLQYMDGVAWRDAIAAAFPAILAKLEAQQAKIDALMLEYCPDEMTEDQIENWAKHQRRVSPERTAEIDAQPQGFSSAK